MANDEKPAEDIQTLLSQGTITFGPFQVDVPMDMDLQPTGGFRIKCPCVGIAGSTQPAVLLLDFSPLAVRRLREGFALLDALTGPATSFEPGPTQQ